MLRPFHSSDAASIARLHASCISTGFLSAMPARFLSLLYGTIAGDAGSTVMVAEYDGRIAGFIAGTVDTSAMYRRILARHWLRFFLVLAPRALHPSTLGRILETMRYGRSKPDASEIRAELLSIAVHADFRGRGAGRELVAGLEDFFVQRTSPVTAYKVATLASDPVSNGFYKSRGFVLLRQFPHHKNMLNEYVKKSVRT